MAAMTYKAFKRTNEYKQHWEYVWNGLMSYDEFNEWFWRALGYRNLSR